MTLADKIVAAARDLVEVVQFDEEHGGLISRDMIRCSDELRILLLGCSARGPAGDGEAGP